MDLETWKRIKRSGSYRRQVKRQFKETVTSTKDREQTVTSSRIELPTSQSEVRDQVVQSGSVSNTFSAYEELENNSNVDSD